MLIVALDYPTVAQAESLMDRLAGTVTWFKVGLELYTAHGAAAVNAVLARGARVMLDLKLHDIPETVERATRCVAALGVHLLTVHTAGGRRMLEAAARARGGTRLLGVTVLTSMDDRDLVETCVEGNLEQVVAARAQLAMECGLDGVVASPHEAARIRAAAPPGFLIVTPGVRPAEAATPAARTPGDDQKRVATAAAARAAGADLVVVGRPIRDARDPRAAAEALVRELG
jgi:orotidine-5'-phosphate decarboxylase